MLCPEVWDFKAPQHRFEHHQDRLADSEATKPNRVTEAIKTHYLNHSVSMRLFARAKSRIAEEEGNSAVGIPLIREVIAAAAPLRFCASRSQIVSWTASASPVRHVSVVLPNTSSIPESFKENILEDSDYYRVDGLRTVELVNKEFIESFVKKGELNLLAIEKRIDVENSVAILPTGHLLLRLDRESYQRLGLEGKPSYFERENPSRYVVTIDLKEEKLTPGKKYYERIYNSLDKLLDLKFSVIVAWEPPEEKLCPSSVAAWFQKRGYAISACHQQMIQRAKYTLDIPLLEDNFNRDEFFEWLGIFSIDGNLVNEGREAEYVSSYKNLNPKMEVGQVQYLQFKGFFTRQKVEKLFNILREYATANNETLPWCSLDVQGFADSPVSWGLKEHNFYTDGDNSYTIVLRPRDDGYILRKSLSSNSKPKITQ